MGADLLRLAGKSGGAGKRNAQGASQAGEEGGRAVVLYASEGLPTGFSKEKILNKAATLDEESLRICYGEDSPDWIGEFSGNTLAKSGGITILDGPPGTGKSTLIAELMRRLYQTHVFYVLSVGQHDALSDPNMVEFWQEQNGAHPKGGQGDRHGRRGEDPVPAPVGQQRVGSPRLLNIADGLMGQMLRVHVLCTLKSRHGPTRPGDSSSGAAAELPVRRLSLTGECRETGRRSTSCLLWRMPLARSTRWRRSSTVKSTNRKLARRWAFISCATSRCGPN